MASNSAAADAERLAGNALFMQGRWEDATNHYSKAIALDAHATAAYNNRAAAYINLKNFDSALEDCDRVLELEPDNTKALIRRAIAQDEIGVDMEAAAADLRKVLRLQPGNREAVQLMQKLDRFLPAASRSDPQPQVQAPPGSRSSSSYQAAARVGRWLRQLRSGSYQAASYVWIAIWLTICAIWIDGSVQTARKEAAYGACSALKGVHDPEARVHAVLIRAGPFHSREELLQLMQPFAFPTFGQEAAELKHLRKIGLEYPSEAGKFYGVEGHASYFYVYGGQATSAATPLNSAMAQACAKKVRGDVVVVRSGPTSSAYDELLTINEVTDAVMFYEGKQPAAVFSERERARAFPGMAADVPSVHFSLGQGSTPEDFRRVLREQLKMKQQARRK